MRTLTCLPWPGRDAADLARALPFFPVVGALVGWLAAGLGWILFAAWPAGGAALYVLATILLTRGLHLDGLADVVDAMGASRDPARRLAVMKDSRIGAFGALALICDLGLRFLAAEHLLSRGLWLWLLVPAVLGRTVLVGLMAFLPYARPEGGTGRAFVQGARAWHFGVALLPAVAFCVAAVGAAGWMWALPAAVVGTILGVWMRRSFGGATGDLLGMANEVTELLLLALAALLCPVLIG